MENRRLFISLPVDPTLSRHLFKKFKSFNLPWSKLKAAQPDQLHLTLKFLGETPIEKIPEIIEALNEMQLNLKDLELIINKPLIFNHKQPKVLSLGLKENTKLDQLYQAIEQVLFDKGIAHKEIRKFSPHLTLARVKQVADFSEFDKFTSWKINQAFTSSYFELMESELSGQGPTYSVLQTFDL